MGQQNLQAGFDAETEYRAIETALLESARGRWFLAEHGRRARRVDGQLLQDAIGRLQSSLRDPPALLGQLRNEIESLQGLMRETRAALVIKPRSEPAAVTASTATQSTDGYNRSLTAFLPQPKAFTSLHGRCTNRKSVSILVRKSRAKPAISMH